MSAKNIAKQQHHEQQKLCTTRPPYRQGRKLTAVKVYTVNDESSHLIICGVPKLQLINDIKKILISYGSVKKIESIPDYPTEEFTEAFHVHFERIQSARIAKRFVDGKNFFGGLLHVFYAPELENVEETRRKLIQRHKDIAVRIKRHKEDPINLDTDKFEPREQYHRKRKYPTLPLTEERLLQHYPNESMKTIYNGIPQEIDPRPVTEPSIRNDWNQSRTHETSSELSKDFKAPYDQNDALGQVVLNLQNKRVKNFRGRSINERTKVVVVRPKIVDTSKLANFNNSVEKPVFPVVKKIESGITIKILPKDEKNKRIVIKDPSASLLVRPSDNLRESIKSVKSTIREAMMKNEPVK